MEINMNKINQNLLLAKSAVKISLEKVKKLKQRIDNIKKGKLPPIPRNDYPLRVKSLDVVHCSAVPPAYILSINTSSGAKIKHKIYPRINQNQKRFEDDMSYIIEPTLVKSRKENEASFFLKLYYEREIKKGLKKDFARIYVVSEAVAQQSHLFNCVRDGNDLVMTPKENLLDAEIAGWTRDNMDFGGNVFNIAIQYIDLARKKRL